MGSEDSADIVGIDRHVHLEGGLDPNWVREQAEAAGQRVPASLEAFWRGEAQPFSSFIEAFLFGSGFLSGRGPVKMALGAIIGRLPPAAGPRGVDLWVSPHFLVRFKQLLSLDELWRGLEDGIAGAGRLGVPVAVVLDAVNHFGPRHGHEVLDLVESSLPEFVVGFSTGGLEGVPFRDWAPVFERARSLGLRIAAHAGENGPGENVREAILDGGVERIVHAVRAAEDPGILDLLAERRIPVDVCPSSNEALVRDLEPHPLPFMLRAGVRCALGTDDPGVIPCDMAGEWAKARAMGLEEREMGLLRRFAIEDAWALQL
jgi:adenosine deaminase